jgi:UDP-glucose 6-dehydrogenase
VTYRRHVPRSHLRPVSAWPLATTTFYGDTFPFTVQKRVGIFNSALEACKDVEAVVIATEWGKFRDIDWDEVYRNMKKPAFIFDGRILLDANKLRNIGFKVR